jgi:hypothetical protein
MSLKACAADKCNNRFEPYSIDQIYCSPRCRTRMGVRAFRNRLKHGGDDDGGGGRQRRLFPKPALLKAKPPKAAPVAEPTLFETDLLAQAWQGRRVRAKRVPRPIIPGIMSTRRKPSARVQPGAKHAA